MKALKHRAYVHVDERRLREKARELPENGIPPELLRHISYDTHLDKLQVQKAATPVEGRRTLEGDFATAFAAERPRAVVMEKSGTTEGDVNAQALDAVRYLAEKLEHPTRLPIAHAEPTVEGTSKRRRKQKGPT
jgi:hypothetical protein